MNNTDTTAMLSSQLANFQRSQIQKGNLIGGQAMSQRKASHGRSSTQQSIHHTGGGVAESTSLIASNQTKMHSSAMANFNSNQPHQAIS